MEAKASLDDKASMQGPYSFQFPLFRYTNFPLPD
jgi:hypothetical protein